MARPALVSALGFLLKAALIRAQLGIEFSRSAPLGRDQLWLDWATFSEIVPREILDTVSPEQQALNEAAQEGAGNKNYSPIRKP